MDWKEEYKKKFVSPEDAVKVIKSGESILIPVATEPQALSKALWARKEELKDIKIRIRLPRCDFGWLGNDFGDSFKVILDTQPGDHGVKAMRSSNDIDLVPYLFGLRFKGTSEPRREEQDIDATMVVVSPPDRNGYCSFGLYLSHKRDYTRRSKKVLAEVSTEPEMNITVSGDNYIHVSEVDYFVEHIPFGIQEQKRVSDNIDRPIAEYVSTIVRDGDLIEIGPGVSSSLPDLGAFDDKHDLGIHSPVIDPPLISLIRRGIVTGKKNILNPNKCVCSGFRRMEDEEDIKFVDGNPLFTVRDTSYVNDIRIISSNENMVAINGILSIDLLGQITADSTGMRMFAGAGGLVDFSLGSMLSKGGCSIAVLRSTNSKGSVSRIVPTHAPGSIISVPWTFADYVVTEYGIAKLFGKSLNERAKELIAIAHPDFRAELTKQSGKINV